MVNPIASSIFSTGAKDTLAAVDVYKQNGTQIINSIQALAQRSGLDVSSLLGGKLSLSTASKLLERVGADVKIDKAALQTRLLEGSSVLKNSLRKLTTGAQDMMYESFEDLGTVKIQFDGVASMVSSADFTELSSFSSFVNDYTKDQTLFKFEDLDGMSSMISGMVTQGSALGVDGIFTKLTDGIEDNGLMCRIVKDTLPGVLREGDFKTLQDITGSRAGKGIGDLFPNFTEMLTTNYTDRFGGRMQDQQLNYDRIIGSLLNVDSQWDVLTREGSGGLVDTGINLLRLMGSSRDFKYLMETGVKQVLANDDRKKYHLLGAHYQPTTVDALIRRYFPQVYISTESTVKRTTTNRGVVDARTLNDLGTIVGALL